MSYKHIKKGRQINGGDDMTIKDVFYATPSAEAIGKELSKRERNQTLTNLDLLYKNINDNGGTLSARDFDVFFEDLQKQGVGIIIRGRNGQPPMFKWGYKLLDVVQAAQEDKQLVKVDKRQFNPGRPKGSRNRTTTESKDVYLSLPDGSLVAIKVPASLDAKTVVSIIQTMKRVA